MVDSNKPPKKFCIDEMINVSKRSVGRETVSLFNPNVLTVPLSKIRKTTLMATLTNKNITAVEIQMMIEAGVNIIKIYLKSDSFGSKMSMLKNIHTAAAGLSEKYSLKEWPVVTAIPLKTYIMKTYLPHLQKSVQDIKKSELMLSNDESFHKTARKTNSIFVDCPDLIKDFEIGKTMAIENLDAVLKCCKVVDKRLIKCEMLMRGEPSLLTCMEDRSKSNDHVAFDFQTLDFVLENNVDIISMECVKHPDQLKIVKEYFADKPRKPLIFISICTERGLNYIDDLIKVCDGVEIMRDLIPTDDISMRYKWMKIQKWIAAKCLQIGKPCILSGDVLTLSTREKNLSESELSDVTNAILEGVTGLGLTECEDTNLTVEILKIIENVCCTVEPFVESQPDLMRMMDEVRVPVNAAEACILSCQIAAAQVDAKVIIIPTVTGRTIRGLFLMKPTCPVITISTKPEVTRLLCTYRGIIPLNYEPEIQYSYRTRIDRRIEYAVQYAVYRGILVYGSPYVVLRRDSEYGDYCDTVNVWYSKLTKKARVECQV